MYRTTVAVLLLLASISANAELKIDLSEERIARGKSLVNQTPGSDG